MQMLKNGGEPEGDQGVRLNHPPPPPPRFWITHENEIIWSQWDQIISF